MRSISGGEITHPHPTLLASLAVDLPMLAGESHMGFESL